MPSHRGTVRPADHADDTDPAFVSSHMPDAKIDQPRIQRAVREILLAIGEDPDREGLLKTPARVARAYAGATERQRNGGNGTGTQLVSGETGHGQCSTIIAGFRVRR